MTSKIDEKELLIAIKRGDKRAFSQLYLEYYDKLCKYLYSLSGNYKQSEDLIQETLIDLWVKRGQLNINTSLNNYLYRSAHNRFINLYKKNLRKKRLINLFHVEAVIELEGLEKDIKEARLIALEKIINQLPPKRKDIFVLSKLNNYKYREIAEMRKISLSTVESQIHKAMIFIRKEMLRLHFEDRIPTWVIFFVSFLDSIDYLELLPLLGYKI